MLRFCPGISRSWLLAVILLATLPLAAADQPATAPATRAVPAPPAAAPAPTPAENGPAPLAPAADGGFQPNTILADGRRVEALWPAPGNAAQAGPVWKDSRKNPVAADQVVRVLLANNAPPTGISQGATTFDGQRIVGNIETYNEKEGLKLRSPVLGPVQVPAALLSRIYIQELATDEDDEALTGGQTGPVAAKAQTDCIVYRNADQSASRLFYLTDGVAKLKNGVDIATAPLERLSYLTLAAPAKLPDGTRDLQVLLTDGSRISGDVAASDPETLTVNSSIGTLKIPRHLIHSLWPRRAGYRPLARVPAQQVKNYGQFDVHFPPRINRTAGGQPFRTPEFNLAGIGMHSYTRADYPLDKAARFVSYVCLDRTAPAQTTCTVRVLVDNAKKAELDLKPGLPGQWLSVPTAGGATLTLEVDFGADQADTGDLVDWINPVLLQ